MLAPRALQQLAPPPTPQTCLFTFRGGRGDANVHTGPVLCVHSENDLIMSGGWDCTVRLWHAETGKWVRTLRGHNAAVLDVMGVRRTVIWEGVCRIVIWDFQNRTYRPARGRELVAAARGGEGSS